MSFQHAVADSDLDRSGRSAQWVRGEDIVWLLFFLALAVVSVRQAPQVIALLLVLTVLQIVEARVPRLSAGRGLTFSILLKLGLCYLLIGWTGGISSTYYLILLFPVLSAATSSSLLVTLAVTAAACLTYLSFLLYVDWNRYVFTREAFGEVGMRVIFLPVVAFLTNQLAEANRVEARRSQAVAAQLEAANRSLRAAEAAVRRSDRLAALGQLTAGLAHELRNPLGTIRASSEMLVKNVDSENEIARELAGFIASEVDRTNSLITRFLDFARPLKLRLENIDVSTVVDAAIAELEQHNPPHPVSVHRNYSPDVPRVAADAELLQRVVYNLLANAAQATPLGGTISVKTRAIDGMAEIAVIDRGTGIEKEHLESIFNPFFTTKSQGVGLGLAIVSKIIDEHRGRITVESQHGQGSTFRIHLPQRQAAAPARTAEA